MISMFNERDIETLIDNQLRNLGWIDNPTDNKRNIYKQSVKTQEQKKLLGNKRPDYVLYESNSNNPLIIIEAKRPNKNIENAIKQATDYAIKIKAPIIYVTDGVYIKNLHIQNNASLILNNESVNEFIKESIALKFVKDNTYNEIDKKIIQSRKDLITIFKSINEDFRNAGIRNGIERIDIFCNILFLKVISELSTFEDKTINSPPAFYLWDNFKNKKNIDLLDFLNKQAFDYFKKSYGGEVLSKINIKENKAYILNNIIDKLNDLWLSDTNADIKGESFEYFLRNYGGADTDFGEYFTPRHIVKLMVNLLNPRFGETIYDPFCGTGGMLIESFKHIKKRMPLNPNTIEQLRNKTVYGRELTSMSRVAKMNMILTGDGHSNIKEIDSYENPVKNKYNIVITNIPFGIKMKTTHVKYYEPINTTSAEICGVLHCLDALEDEGRAGIIVPDGILSTKNNAYTKLRKIIIEKYNLETIISLPNYTFLPNTGIKSNILLLKKNTKFQKNQKHIWHFNIKNDGFTPDAYRKKLDGDNDIDILQSKFTELSINNKSQLNKFGFKIILKNEINKNNKYLLKKPIINKLIFNCESIKLKDVCYIKKGKSITKSIAIEGNIPVIAGGKTSPYTHNDFNYKGNIITISASGANAGFIQYHNDPIWASDCSVVYSEDDQRLNMTYLYHVLKKMQDIFYNLQRGTGQPHVYPEDIGEIEIPLPKTEEQLEIVKSIENKQKEINTNKDKIIIMQNEIKKEIEKLFK